MSNRLSKKERDALVVGSPEWARYHLAQDDVGATKQALLSLIRRRHRYRFEVAHQMEPEPGFSGCVQYRLMYTGATQFEGITYADEPVGNLFFYGDGTMLFKNADQGFTEFDYYEQQVDGIPRAYAMERFLFAVDGLLFAGFGNGRSYDEEADRETAPYAIEHYLSDLTVRGRMAA